MERDFEELKMMFAQKRSSVPNRQVTPVKEIQVLAFLKTGHIQTMIVFFVTAFAIVFIDKLSSEKIKTSSFGFWLLLCCALYYAFSKAYLLHRLNRVKPTQPVFQTIALLEQYKKLNVLVQTYGELLYAIVLSAGVYLYIQPIVPFLQKEHPYVMESVLGVYILWVCVYSLFFKRKKLKTELQILDTYIQTLKSENE